MKNIKLFLLLLFVIAMCPFGQYEVLRVIDGDTFEIEKIGRVRLVGIDAYDSKNSRMIKKQTKRTGYSNNTIKSLGSQATDFAKEKLLGQCVILTKDYKNTGSYGRLLRQLEVNGEDFGELLLLRELGNVYCGDKKVAKFKYYNQLSKFKCKTNSSK